MVISAGAASRVVPTRCWRKRVGRMRMRRISPEQMLVVSHERARVREASLLTMPECDG
jgi:hypothetical protein